MKTITAIWDVPVYAARMLVSSYREELAMLATNDESVDKMQKCLWRIEALEASIKEAESEGEA